VSGRGGDGVISHAVVQLRSRAVFMEIIILFQKSKVPDLLRNFSGSDL